MRISKTLLTTAAALALSFAMTAAHAESDTGGTGVEQSAEGKGATNKSDKTMPDSGAGSMQGGGESTGNAPGGTGVGDSAAGEGATNKTAEPMPSTGAGSTQAGGDSTGNAEGGTGVGDSAAGEGATNKTVE